MFRWASSGVRTQDSEIQLPVSAESTGDFLQVMRRCRLFHAAVIENVYKVEGV